jgi:hypothetical protein
MVDFADRSLCASDPRVVSDLWSRPHALVGVLQVASHFPANCVANGNALKWGLLSHTLRRVCDMDGYCKTESIQVRLNDCAPGALGARLHHLLEFYRKCTCYELLLFKAWLQFRTNDNMNGSWP